MGYVDIQRDTSMQYDALRVPQSPESMRSVTADRLRQKVQRLSSSLKVSYMLLIFLDLMRGCSRQNVG